MIRRTRRTYRKRSTRMTGSGRVKNRRGKTGKKKTGKKKTEKKKKEKKKTGKKKQGRRKGPKESAKMFKVGAVKTGLYGKKWKIVTYKKKDGKRVKKWQKV